MASVARCLRVGILLIVPACWFVLIVSRVTAEPAVPGGGKVELKDVKYSGLIEAVKAQRGKVVLVDVWATFCPPCMKNYPHVLKLQQELAAKGLVCISVSVDLPNKKNAAQEFLQKQNSTTKMWGIRSTLRERNGCAPVLRLRKRGGPSMRPAISSATAWPAAASPRKFLLDTDSMT